MKGLILVAALALSGCTSTQLAYTFGAGPSPQRLQELEAQKQQEQYELDQKAKRAELWRTRCQRHHCKTDEELRPKVYHCSDPGLSDPQKLACAVPGLEVTTDISDNITDWSFE